MYRSSLCMPHIACLCVCLPQDTELLGDGAGGLFQSGAHTGCVFFEPLYVSYKQEDLAPPSGGSPVLSGQKPVGAPESRGNALNSRLKNYYGLPEQIPHISCWSPGLWENCAAFKILSNDTCLPRPSSLL